VLKIKTSASSNASTTSKPAFCKQPTINSPSATLEEQPKLSTKTLRCFRFSLIDPQTTKNKANSTKTQPKRLINQQKHKHSSNQQINTKKQLPQKILRKDLKGKFLSYLNHVLIMI
jgi:hypothetical protein